MDDLKALTKLVKLCRKLGVKSYKNDQVELVLTDESQPIVYKRSKGSKKSLVESDDGYASDAPSAEALLFWSASGNDELVESHEN